MDGDRGIPDTMSIINQFINLWVRLQPTISNKHIITMGIKGIKYIIQIKVSVRINVLRVGTSGVTRTKPIGQIE